MANEKETSKAKKNNLTEKSITRVKDYAHFFRKNDLSEFSIEEGGTRITFKKEQSAAQLAVSDQGYSEHLPPVNPAGVGTVPMLPALEKEPEEKKDHLIEIKSPFVGTYYEAPAPDAKPFISVGDNISVGTIIGIVEAMKVMNEIESPSNGKVVEILVKNGDPVTAEQVIVRIE